MWIFCLWVVPVTHLIPDLSLPRPSPSAKLISSSNLWHGAIHLLGAEWAFNFGGQLLNLAFSTKCLWSKSHSVTGGPQWLWMFVFTCYHIPLLLSLADKPVPSYFSVILLITNIFFVNAYLLSSQEAYLLPYFSQHDNSCKSSQDL